VRVEMRLVGSMAVRFRNSYLSPEDIAPEIYPNCARVEGEGILRAKPLARHP
jgi:hypothetical protein